MAPQRYTEESTHTPRDTACMEHTVIRGVGDWCTGIRRVRSQFARDPYGFGGFRGVRLPRRREIYGPRCWSCKRMRRCIQMHPRSHENQRLQEGRLWPMGNALQRAGPGADRIQAITNRDARHGTGCGDMAFALRRTWPGALRSDANMVL